MTMFISYSKVETEKMFQVKGFHMALNLLAGELLKYALCSSYIITYIVWKVEMISIYYVYKCKTRLSLNGKKV